MNRALPYIFGRTFNTPLTITARRLEPLIAGLRAASFARGPARRANGDEEEDDDDDRYPEPPEGHFEQDDEEWEGSRAGYAVSPAGVARIGISDVLCRKAGQIDADSTELESYMRIDGMLRLCMVDPRVKGVMLDIDSPGGESGGLFELCRNIRSMSAIKPIWAVANDDAYSAGYAIASAADQVWITTTGGVGSIGVIAMHTDQSGFDEETGLSFTYIFAGARKADFNPHEPLSTEARGSLQLEVDRLYGLFVGMVANYRGLKPSAVAATEAATFHGANALRVGLADRVGTFGEAVAAMTEALGEEQMTVGGLLGLPGGNTRLAASGSGPTIEATAEPVAAGIPTAAELNAIQEDLAAALPPAAVRNVVRLDQVRQATSAVRRDASEIVNLCAIAGMAELASQFIEAETPLAAVRADLIRRQAEASAAAGLVALDVSQTVTSPAVAQHSELTRVVNERFAAQAGRKGI